MKYFEFIYNLPAWLSAIGAILVAIITIYKVIQSQRFKLKVEMMPYNLLGQNEFHYMTLKITNFGQRHVYISNIYWMVCFRIVKHDFQCDKLVNIKFPIKLEDGEPIEFTIPIYFYDGFKSTDISKEFACNTQFPYFKSIFTKICVETTKKRIFKKRIDKNLRKDLIVWSRSWKNLIKDI